ncbi:PE-PGRS family protein [Streptomyces lavendulocolor]|uniref:PE-PGRS family protein n=1 Tax=Streptomyces lavendulocolor TaxID=67316 RepID=UPI003C2D382E
MTGGEDAYARVLTAAGLEVVAGGPADDVLPPWAARRPVVAFDAEPTVAVRRDRPDVVAEVNAQWHRLAAEYGVIGPDGTFLVCAPDASGGSPGGALPPGPGHPDGWTRVRLAGAWDLAGVLGERPGRPEFLTASTDGDALLGVTSEEYDIRLVAKARVKRWQEETARAAARETPRERDAAWASWSHGPRPTERLHTAWLAGLAHNQGAPDEVLLRLLGRTRPLLRRRLPAPVVDAAVAHPDWAVRADLADFQPDMTAEQWTRLVFGEPGQARRLLLAGVAADRGAGLTDAGYERLATDPHPLARATAARLPGLPAHLLTALAVDPEAQVRAVACPPAWPHLGHPAREALLSDPDGTVRRAALLRYHEGGRLPRALFDELGLGQDAVETYALERAHAEELAAHPDPAWRRALATGPGLDPDLVARLAEDPDDEVRLEVSIRPDLTEARRSAVRVHVHPDAFRRHLPWVADLHDDPEAMRRLAASSHPWVRGAVARARRLPPDVVDRLAGDGDRVVRLFLAESCDNAPGWMLLEVWRWWPGSLSRPDRPRGHPNFPRSGLLRYADDPHPRMRLLALDDPESTAGLVERLGRDPDLWVRARAAADPRLSAASAVRLLDDPRALVRQQAMLHPALPARTLIRLLRDGATAEDAARNPALPVPVMHAMIDAREPGGRPAVGRDAD